MPAACAQRRDLSEGKEGKREGGRRGGSASLASLTRRAPLSTGATPGSLLLWDRQGKVRHSRKGGLRRMRARPWRSPSARVDTATRRFAWTTPQLVLRARSMPIRAVTSTSAVRPRRREPSPARPGARAPQELAASQGSAASFRPRQHLSKRARATTSSGREREEATPARTRIAAPFACRSRSALKRALHVS